MPERKTTDRLIHNQKLIVIWTGLTLTSAFSPATTPTEEVLKIALTIGCGTQLISTTAQKMHILSKIHKIKNT